MYVGVPGTLSLARRQPGDDVLLTVCARLRAFGGKVRSWCTFNEPGVYTFSGYCMGGFPPAKVMRLRTAGRVLKHMLIAHTDAYRLIKAMPGAAPTLPYPSSLSAPVGVRARAEREIRVEGLHQCLAFRKQCGRWVYCARQECRLRSLGEADIENVWCRRLV